MISSPTTLWNLMKLYLCKYFFVFIISFQVTRNTSSHADLKEVCSLLHQEHLKKASNIGQRDIVCPHYHDFKWVGEAPHLCCLNGQVQLPPLSEPLKPPRTLLLGKIEDFKHFLKASRLYSNLF